MDAKKPLQVLVPAHSHLALRRFALEHGTSASRLVLDALDRAYPQFHVNEIELPHAARGDRKGGAR